MVSCQKNQKKAFYAWLNGKLMIALLIESMMGNADFSPFDGRDEEYLEGNEDDNPLTVDQCC